MAEKLNKNIYLVNKGEKIEHAKATEVYLNVVFKYQNEKWEGYIPIVYRRLGINIKNEIELIHFLNQMYELMNPKNYSDWLNKQIEFWNDEKKGATVTREFFDCLSGGGWKCASCELPKNPNPQRRIQDLKELGYLISTNTKKKCTKCNSIKTHILLLPVDRVAFSGSGYEVISKKLRTRIMKVLNTIDVYENKINPHTLPDHKFSEIRWDNKTKTINSEVMTEEEIKEKFQLLTNQRNQEKREVCRNCFQTGKRGVIFGIPFFYKGTDKWDMNIPKIGNLAKEGCVGCGWYDISEWRRQLVLLINDYMKKGKNIL